MWDIAVQRGLPLLGSVSRPPNAEINRNLQEAALSGIYRCSISTALHRPRPALKPNAGRPIGLEFFPYPLHYWELTVKFFRSSAGKGPPACIALATPVGAGIAERPRGRGGMADATDLNV
jgi:hypothetical protein